MEPRSSDTLGVYATTGMRLYCAAYVTYFDIYHQVSFLVITFWIEKKKTKSKP